MIRFLRRWWWALLIAVAVAAVGGFLLWASTPPVPMDPALDVLASDANVAMETDRWLVFRPTTTDPVIGFILYPGGRVDARSYAPAMHTIAAQGYLAVITPMPLNLAFFDQHAAAAVIDAYPAITTWVIGGHSLGGVMAARFAHSNPDVIHGVVLWASYPDPDGDLSTLDIAATSIYGTADGLTSLAEIESSRALLPPDTTFVAIEGGNHAQFGWYGAQAGDNQATISREAQQEQIVAATVSLLDSLMADEP